MLAWAATCVFTLAVPASGQSLEPETLLGHVKYLASDELAGREAGEPGADSAAAYIARLFHAYGLEPLGSDGYYQRFEIVTTIAIAADSRLVLQSARGSRELTLYDEWVPYNFSAAGSLSGDLIGAGYGLNEDDYDEFKSRGGRIVLLRGGVPEDFDPTEIMLLGESYALP